MNKEELEKEAEEYTGNLLKDVNCTLGNPRARQINSIDIQDAYLAGAEPREKRIAELEAENEQIKNSDTLCKLIGEQKIKIKELEAQIEKMKQCGNCGNGTVGNCEYCTRKEKQTHTDTTDYWRLKERR